MQSIDPIACPVLLPAPGEGVWSLDRLVVGPRTAKALSPLGPRRAWDPSSTGEIDLNGRSRGSFLEWWWRAYDPYPMIRASLKGGTSARQGHGTAGWAGSDVGVRVPGSGVALGLRGSSPWTGDRPLAWVPP
jgi:hypothetical protein